jgi:hypothetical protein
MTGGMSLVVTWRAFARTDVGSADLRAVYPRRALLYAVLLRLQGEEGLFRVDAADVLAG